MDQNLPNLLKQAFSGTTNDVRAAAEQQIQNAMQSNIQFFLMQCAQCLSNEQQESLIRQASATVIKNATRNQNIPSPIPDQLKQELLKTLITKDKQIKRLASNAVAALAVKGFINKDWLDLIPNLTKNLGHGDVEIKKAAIMTLGFICEYLKEQRLESCLDQPQIEQILSGILLGLKKEETDIEVKQLALDGLQNSLGFMMQQYEKREVRDYMLDLLVNICNNDHKLLKIKGLQCLMEVSKNLYHLLSEVYMSAFSNVLLPMCSNPDDEIAVPAIEVWGTLAQEDLDRTINYKSKYHVRTVQDSLVKVLLQNLMKPTQNQDDDEQFFLISDLNAKDSSYKCLQLICEVIGDPVLQNFLPFISNVIEDQNPNNRVAAMMAFSAMLEGPQPQTLIQMISGAIPKIIHLLNDQHNEVKKWTSVTLFRIAEHHSPIILHNFENLLPHLIQAMKLEPKIAQNISWVFYYLSESLSSIDQSHPFKQNFEQIVQSLIQLSYVPNQDIMLIDVSFSALTNMIKHCQNIQVSQVYLSTFVQLFQQLNQIQSKEQRDTVKRGICTAMHTCLYTISNLTDPNVIEKIYSLIIQDFQQQRDVHDDGICVITALAHCAKQQFLNYLPNFFEYLKAGIEKYNEKEVFKASLDAIIQLSRQLQEFGPYLTQILPVLLSLQERTDFNNELKLSIFECIGDSYLYFPDRLSDLLEKVIQLVLMGFQAAIQLQKSTDQNQQDYSDNLKEVLVQTLTCLLHSTQDNNQDRQKMLVQVPHIMEIFKLTTDKQLAPTVDYLRNVLALISDIAQFYGNQVSLNIKQQFVQDIVNQLQKFIHIQENQQILKYAMKQISKLK